MPPIRPPTSLRPARLRRSRRVHAAKAAGLDYMATVLKCDTRPWAKPAACRASGKAAHA